MASGSRFPYKNSACVPHELPSFSDRLYDRFNITNVIGSASQDKQIITFNQPRQVNL